MREANLKCTHSAYGAIILSRAAQDVGSCRILRRPATEAADQVGGKRPELGMTGRYASDGYVKGNNKSGLCTCRRAGRLDIFPVIR